MIALHRWSIAALVLTGLIHSTGCGEPEPFDYVPVTGSVKYSDGSLIQADGVEVTFYSETPPKDPKIHPRPGVATVNVADGTFTEATSHTHNDGIVPGPHKVTVQTFDKDHNPTNVLPPEFTDPTTTPLRFDTTKQKTAEFTIPKQ
jgi:hypothetical protein